MMIRACRFPVLFLAAILAYSSDVSGDTFKNTKTGVTISGSIIAQSETGGKKTCVVKLTDGRIQTLSSDEWELPGIKSKDGGIPDTFEKIRDFYNAQVQEAQGEYEQRLKKFPTEYLDELQKLEESFTKQGSLDGVVAAKNETKRFKLALAIPDEAVVAEPAALAELQRKFKAFPEENAAKRDDKIGRLAGAYVARLDQLKKDLTKQSKITEALEVDAEIKKVNESTKVKVVETAPEQTTPKPEVAPAPSMKGLILYYSFDKDEGGKVTDKSGQGRDGKVVGAKWVTKGKVGGGYQFGGADSIEASRGKLVLDQSGMTISAWFNPSELGKQRVIYSENTAGGPNLLVGIEEGDRIAFRLFGNGWHDAYAVGAPSVGKWNHVVATKDSSGGMKVYVDGALNGANPFTRVGGDGTPVVQSVIGAASASGRNIVHFSGIIDEVMIFDRALSESEVVSLYKSQGGRFDGSTVSPGKLPPSLIKSTPSTKSAPSVSAKPAKLPRITLPAGNGMKHTVTSLYKTASPSVVVVVSGNGHGSGFCIGRRDIIMTNAHVVRRSDVAMVHPFAYAGNDLKKADPVEADVIYRNDDEDIAILQLRTDKAALKPLPVTQKVVAAGEKVYAIGSPGLGDQVLTQTITEGIISSGVREFGGQKWLQHTAAVNPGNSGGPLLNEMCEVVGMNTLKAFLDGVNFAIPAEKMREVFSR